MRINSGTPIPTTHPITIFLFFLESPLWPLLEFLLFADEVAVAEYVIVV